MGWLKWPFKFSINAGFSVGHDEQEYGRRSKAQVALDAALEHDQTTTPGTSTAVEKAEAYLAFLEKHK